MKVIIFDGRATSLDKSPLFCRENIEITTRNVVFKRYPLSLIEITLDTDSITIDGVKYELKHLPITIHKVGKHCTKYREIVEENITITIEAK